MDIQWKQADSTSFELGDVYSEEGERLLTLDEHGEYVVEMNTDGTFVVKERH